MARTASLHCRPARVSETRIPQRALTDFSGLGGLPRPPRACTATPGPLLVLLLPTQLAWTPALPLPPGAALCPAGHARPEVEGGKEKAAVPE